METAVHHDSQLIDDSLWHVQPRSAKMRYIVTDVPWSLLLSVSVCLLDITMSCARMEPIEMPFGVLARVSPVNGPHQGEGQF